MPETINVADDDLSQILVHLLEHAMRETYAIHDPKERKIQLQIQCEKEKLKINCSHTAHYHTNIFDQGITTDFPQKEVLDLFVIEKITKKYQGHLLQDKDNQTDQITLFLSLR
ncbi:GHKL domain-containing protein [Enterococcus dispar]|uniref:GHKL domain-containing protein n=1 Tax=Enterococcus dispar TaxID=44009 RepID=UPI00232F047E|nr:GHKL domain-containing protein [Enterococcus dispar]WCG33805.1 GHKL domain-containing protein [Enterococcus dispar]